MLCRRANCTFMCVRVLFFSFFFLSWRRQTPGNDYRMLLQVEIDPEACVARGGGGGNGPFPFHTTLTMQSHASVIKSTCRFSCRRVSQGLYTCFSFICCFYLFSCFFLNLPTGPHQTLTTPSGQKNKTWKNYQLFLANV